MDKKSERILAWIKIPVQLIVSVMCVLSGLLLLINDNFAKKLHLKNFRDEYGFIFGIIFLVSLSLIICYLIIFANKKCQKFLTKRSLIKKFKNLQPIYKSALYEMYRSSTHSIKMELSNSVAAYLSNIHAIGSSQLSTGGTVFDFYLQPWVYWGIESEIKDMEKFVKYFEKKKDKLKDQKDFKDHKEAYENAKKFLEFIKQQIEVEYEDDEW